MRFGRRAGRDAADEPGTDIEPTEDATEATGPYDASQVDLEEHEGIDLGSLVVTPSEGMELRLEVDEASGQVAAAVLVGEDGAVELRAFSASRGGGAWDDLRPQISADVARLGGTATEQQGAFGTELLCLVPVQAPDGAAFTQPSRVVAHEGQAWLLRATIIGQPALEAEVAGRWEEAVRQVVVRRGREAMPPGQPLPLHLPPEARRVE